MSRQKIVIIVLSIIGMVGTFLPWVKAFVVGTVVGISGPRIEYELWLVFILFLIPLFICLVNKSEYLTGWVLNGVIFAALLSTLLSLNYLTITNLDRRFGMPEGSESRLTLGPAPYIVFIVGILISVFGFVLKQKADATSNNKN